MFEPYGITAQLTGLMFALGECPAIGPEDGHMIADGVTLFFQSNQHVNPVSPHPKGGSYRFVRIVDRQIVAAMQVISPTGKSGTVTNMYCRPERRRHGHMTELIVAARDTLGDVGFSPDLTPDGIAWVSSLDENSFAVAET